MLTAFATTETAVEAMRLGAYDYQIKPVKVDELTALCSKALEKVELVRENRELIVGIESANDHRPNPGSKLCDPCIGQDDCQGSPNAFQYFDSR